MLKPRTLWSAALLLAACVSPLVVGASARAQTTVSVLGLTSMEGDDEFARNFTGVLRHASSQVEGWTVSDRDVALSQMELTHDCASSDAACMVQIAGTLGSARVIYGTIQRAAIGTRYEFQITLFLFNSETGQVDERVTEEVPSSSSDIDALREPARAMIRALSASSSPGSIRATGSPDLEVRIDGVVVGRTDATGSYMSDPLPPGPHTVQVGSAPEQPVTIAGNEVVASFDTVSSGGGGGGGSILPWIGVGLLGVAAVSLAVSIFAMVRIDQLNGDPMYEMYRRSVGAMDPMATSVCSDAFYDPGSVIATLGQSTCGEGGTMEILQYVFLGVAGVSAGVGIALIVVGGGEGSSSSDTASVRLRLTPSFSTSHASVGATLEF